MGNTDYLYNSPSFITGVARAIDLYGSFTEYNISETGQQADAIALYNDVKAIGNDFYSSIPLD
jgi:hypothetical protein